MSSCSFFFYKSEDRKLENKKGSRAIDVEVDFNVQDTFQGFACFDNQIKQTKVQKKRKSKPFMKKNRIRSTDHALRLRSVSRC